MDILGLIALPQTAKCAAACYMLIGTGLFAMTGDIPQWYIALLLFLAFKVIFQYHKCTLSYLECKARGVDRKQGYLNNILGSVQSLFHDPEMFRITLCFTIYISYVYFWVLGKSMII